MTNNTEEVIPLSPPPKNKSDDANNYSSTFSSLTTPSLLRLRSPLGKGNRAISRGDIDDDDDNKSAAAARDQTVKCTFSKKKLFGIIVSSIVVVLIVIVVAVAMSNGSSKDTAVNSSSAAISSGSNAAVLDAVEDGGVDDVPKLTNGAPPTPSIATVTQDTINTTDANNSSLTVADIAGADEEKKESEYASSSGFGFNLLPSSSWGSSHKPKSGKESKATDNSAKSAKDSKATSGKASKKDRDEPDDPTPPPPRPRKYIDS